MLRDYKVRKTYKNNISREGYNASAKIIFKTENSSWLDTTSPIIVPVSIHSRFHHGIEGFMKRDCFISNIRANTKGEITLYMAENAHINTMSLIYKNAYEKCQKDAYNLANRFESTFSSLNVVYSDFVTGDRYYQQHKESVSDMYNRDLLFQSLVKQRASAFYTSEKKELFPNKETYLEKSIHDILEQCAAMLVFDSKGYRFYFYPETLDKSFLYLLQDKSLSMIATYLSMNSVKIHKEANNTEMKAV